VLIEVSRLNGKSFVMNCELIRFIESSPDTIITLVGGEKIMVRDSVEEVVQKTIQYRKRLYQEPLDAITAQNGGSRRDG